MGNDCAVHLANKGSLIIHPHKTYLIGYTVFCGVNHLHEISILRSRVDRSEKQRLLIPVLLHDATNDELLEILAKAADL